MGTYLENNKRQDRATENITFRKIFKQAEN